MLKCSRNDEVVVDGGKWKKKKNKNQFNYDDFNTISGAEQLCVLLTELLHRFIHTKMITPTAQ